MKPPRFDYACPTTINEAVTLLAASKGAAKPIAGGQSLMPLLAFRMAAPNLLVDLRKVPDLSRIDIGEDAIRLGAMVRWRDIERDARLRRAHPLLVEAIEHVAHYQIRNRGTVGGSIAHADPAAEMPGIAVTCDATMTVAGVAGTRTLAAREFFTGPLTTALNVDEILIAVELPAWPSERRWAFQEFARRRGDFALAGAAVFFDVDAGGRAANTHIGVIGAGSVPQRIEAAEVVLNGKTLDEKAIAACAAAAAAAVDPPADLHASTEYRRALVETLVSRALTQAAQR